MTDDKPRILVTDGEQRSSLAIVRSLGRAGYDVTVCGRRSRTLAGASRYSDESFRVPDPRESPNAYRDAVLRLVREESIGLLIPTTDTSIGLLVDLPDTIPELRIPQSGRQAYERLSDKHVLTAAASELGIAVPKQVVISAPEAPGASALENLGYPLALKPSRSSVRTSGATGNRIADLRVLMANSGADVESMLRTLPPEAYPVLAQERIIGPGKGVFLLRWGGRIHAAFAHRRIREKPPTGGVSVYRESVPLKEEILGQARRLLDHFDWSGVAMVEFKEDRETGVPFLMEVNARFWGSLQLAIDAGVDFPRLLVELATSGETEPITSYRPGVRSRWLWGEVDHVIGCIRADPNVRHAHPELPHPTLALLRLLVPWFPGDRYEVLRISDIGPFVHESIQWMRALRD